MTIETASMEREVQRLQEKNQQLKAEAKRIMGESQSVSDVLREKDIERIEMALREYETNLFEAINNVNHYHEKSIDKTAHETVL